MKVDLYLLHVDLNVLLQAVAVQVQHQVMHKVKAITHNDQWQLVCQFGFLRKRKRKSQQRYTHARSTYCLAVLWTVSLFDLEEVLDTLRVVAIALPADSLHLFYLTCLAGSLNVFEVDLWVLAEVYNGSQEVEQP